MPSPSFELPKRASRFLLTLAALHFGIACSEEDRPPPPASDEDDDTSAPSSKPAVSDGGAPVRNFCAGNNEGCPCTEEGKQVDCGKVLRTSGDYISCSVGKRTCEDGVWGECIGDRVIQIASDEPPPFELSAVPSPQTCINNPCDPYCMEYTDGPEHVDPGGPVIVTDGGVTLGKTLTGSEDSPCDGIDVFPSPQIFVIDSLSALHGSGSLFGLLGQYYDQRGSNIGSTWTPEVERIDSNVDFYWGSGSPASGISSDNFSTRWTGTLVPPTSGGYTFHLTVSDGARLWLNGSLLLDAWSDRAPSELSTSSVLLNADQAYDFKLETYENANTATASLAWSGPATAGSKATIDTIYFRPPSGSGSCSSAPPASDCSDATLEAELMTQSTGAAVTNGWNIYSNGYIAKSHSFSAGENTVTITARSDYVDYAWATMVVSIGGSQVYTTTVDSSSWKTFSFPYAATAGNKEVRVQFTNDYSGISGDRNLYVDKVHIACPATASPSASCDPTITTSPSEEAGPEPTGTQEDPITSGRKRFEVVGNPKTCVDGEIQAAWTIDKLGVATIDNTGLFEVVAPVAGDVTINAYAGNFMATGLATVIVKVRDDADVSTAVSEKFSGPGSGTDPMRVLYPYVDTVFPLGVRAPVVQWDTGGTNAVAVRIALTAPNFLWEQIIPEPPNARFEIPLGAWKALEQTAKGGEAAIVVQRLIGSSLRSEVVRPFEFATAPLRGQIIYTEYGRGSNEHAYQMAANPGSTSVAVNMFRDDTAGPGPSGQCPVCHSVSADGTTFITSDAKWSGYPGVASVKPNGILDQLSDYSTAATYQAGVSESMDFRGFAWAPITPDGKYAFATNNFWGNTTSSDVGFSGAATTFPSTLSIPDGMKSGGNGTGLLGHYYPSVDFSGTPWLRLDPYVRFDWGAAAPSSALEANAFSVRWQGELQAFYSEDHTFYVASSDGVRLRVGGQVVIDQLTASSSSPTTYSGTAPLVRGQKTEVVLELVENGGNANIELSWESTSTKRGIIPQTQLYWDDAGRGVLGQYFDNKDFTAKRFERVDPEVSADWSSSSPALSMNGETFSVRWDGKIDAPVDGSYEFCVTIDDGAMVTIDGNPVLDIDILDSERCGAPMDLEQGLHDLRVDYYEDTGIATMRLDWEVFDSDGNLVIARERIPQPRLYLPASYTAPTSGVTATYYDTRTFNSASPTNPTNPRALTRIEAGIDHDWGASTTREDYYRLQAGTDLAARYTGLIEAPCTGFTQFRALADDGAQLWIDRVLIASRTTPGEALGFKYMTEGEKYEFKLDWNHASVNAFIKLEWRPCGAASWALVPAQYFHPSGDLGDSGFVRLGGDNANGAEYWAWQLTKTANVASTDVTASSPYRWGLEGAAMMVPSFAPDGSKMVFIDGDQDGGAGWRKGLSLFDFDASSKVFSNRRTIVNTWPFGHTIKWPSFESDSRSVVYSAGPSASRCCVNIRYTTYGNMAPTDNYESPGRLYSVDSESQGAKPVPLARASNGERNVDANKAWQPTMLPVATGGYRWVVFTSTRPYGNTINTVGQNDYTSFKSYSPMLNTDQLQSQLWVAAVEDAPSGDSDRSRPAFWLPNQRYNEDPSNGMINERGFWALDPCRPVGDDIASTCEVDEDCCGGGGDSPTAVCKIDVPVAYPVTRHCTAVTDVGCGLTSQVCAVNDDCCSGLVCADSICQEPPGGDDYAPANFERVYQANCNFDATPEWHFFDWQATTPDTNAYIDFYVQTAEDPAQFVVLPPVPSPVDDPEVFFIGRAIGASSKGSWIGTDIGAILAGNGVKEHEYVKITARLVPNQELTEAPVLHDFRLNYSCPPNQ